ncbi:MAG TPA: hypothetical protein VGN36_03180 [Sphingorhabdus sp.]|nr:hypothetical protein [Sphingorhabdus sp.]
MRDKGELCRLNDIKSWRYGRDATDAAMKPRAIAMLSSIIILFVHCHPVAIRRSSF